MSDLSDAKTAAREAAFARRKAAKAEVDPAPALAALAEVLAPRSGAVISGYMAIRTELDPLPVMTDWAARGEVCVPVIDGPGLALSFRQWHPEAEMTDGPFGAAIPAEGADLIPDVLIVPLLAFDPRGHRLGYGGGYYDRTLAHLRAVRHVTAIGLAFEAQRDDALPVQPTDQRLDAIVTEAGILWPTV